MLHHDSSSQQQQVEPMLHHDPLSTPTVETTTTTPTIDIPYDSVIHDEQDDNDISVTTPHDYIKQQQSVFNESFPTTNNNNMDENVSLNDSNNNNHQHSQNHHDSQNLDEITPMMITTANITTTTTPLTPMYDTKSLLSSSSQRIDSPNSSSNSGTTPTTTTSHSSLSNSSSSSTVALFNTYKQSRANSRAARHSSINAGIVLNSNSVDGSNSSTVCSIPSSSQPQVTPELVVPTSPNSAVVNNGISFVNNASSMSVKNVKHTLENDYKYFEEHVPNQTTSHDHNGQEYCKLSETLHIDVEKSKTVNKFFIEKRDDNAIQDLFAKNCLHLYNGEFTVMKHDEKESVNILPHNAEASNLLYYEQARDVFEFVTRRMAYHPNDFMEDQLNILTKFYRFRLEAGELEPYFLSLELINAKTKAKLSERFYFHMISHQMINGFYDELDVKKQLQKQLDQQPKALFSLSHVLKGEQLTDIYAVIFVYKTLQGATSEHILKQHHAGRKNHTLVKDTQSECQQSQPTPLDDFQGLKAHKEPFLFSFCPVKENGIHAIKYFLPMDVLFQHITPQNATESESGEATVSSKRQASYVDAMCELVSQQAENSLSFHTPHTSRECDLKELLQAETDVIRRNLKKLKAVPGYLVFESFKFNPKKFENDPVERLLLFGSELEKPLFTTSGAWISLEEVIQKIQLRNMSILNPKDPQQEKELRKCCASLDNLNYQSYRIEELHEKLPKFPHFDFSHLLYISPVSLNIDKFKVENLSSLDTDMALLENLAIKKFKAKNVLVKIEYMEAIGKPAPRIISPVGQSLVSEIYCNVVFDCDHIIRFIDEIKIALPLPIEKENHLVISLYHLVIEKQGQKRKKTLGNDGQVPKICFGYSVLTIKDIVDNHCSKMTDFTYTYSLPIYQKLTGNYLSDAKRLSVNVNASSNQLLSLEKRRHDPKKISFLCNTRVCSTIYPNEKLLLQFFADCAPFISIIKDGSNGQVKELTRAVKDCRRSIENLMKVPFSKIVSHFTLIMDMLLSVMCRIPDVLHSFVTEAEQMQETSRSSTLFGESTVNVAISGGSSSTEDEMLRSISARFGLEPPLSSSASSSSGAGDRKSLKSSILAAKRKSFTNNSSPPNSTPSPENKDMKDAAQPKSTLQKRFSLKNILKRKSKEVDTSTTPSPQQSQNEIIKRVAQPGEDGFNLLEYLKAQQEQEQYNNSTQQESHASSLFDQKQNQIKNDKMKKRMSLTDRLFNRHKSTDGTAASPITESSLPSTETGTTTRKSITFTTSNLTASRESQNQGDLFDFLGISNVLFDLQKTVFQVIVSMLKGAAVITDCADRSNKLLNTYVNYVFKDIVMTQSPVYVNLIELFTDVLGKADDSLTVSVPTDDEGLPSHLYQSEGSGRRAGNGILRKSIQDMFGNTKRSSLNTDTDKSATSQNNRSSYSMNMSLFAIGSAPVYYESLNYSWFFLDLILKSYLLCQREKTASRAHMSEVQYNLLSEREREALTNDHGYKFSLLLKELIGALAEKAVFYKDDFANFFVASQINNQLAFFFRDLLGCGEIKSELVFDLMEIYFREFVVKKTVTINTIKLGIDFLQIICDFPQFMELNFANYHPKEYIHHEAILCPPFKLLTNILRDCVTKFKAEVDVHNSAVKVLRYILTKEECLHLSQQHASKERLELLARIFFPYVVMVLENLNAMETVPEMTLKQHLKCCLWILSNLNPSYFTEWLRSSEKLDALIKLLAFYIDQFELRGRNKFETNSFKCFQDIFSQVNTLVHPRVTQIVNNNFDNLKLFEPTHKDLSSFIKLDIRDSEGAKYLTDTKLGDKQFIEYVMFIIAKMLQHVSLGTQKKVILELTSQSVEIVTNYVQEFTSIFRANSNNTYWKWLYGALLLGKEFSASTLESFISGKNSNDHSISNSLMTVLEKVYESDIITIDKLSKLFDEATDAENEIILDEENKIKASTLNRLVARVCGQNISEDSNFTNTFLVTYRSFCTPETLLTLMMSYVEYHILPLIHQEANNKNMASLVLRMLNTVRVWVQDHSYDFNNHLNASMMNFIYRQVGRLCQMEKQSSSGYISIANKIKERIEANLISNGESREKLEKMFNEKKPFNIKQWEPSEIAKQITLLESNIFTAIEPKEFFGLGWTKKDKMTRAPNISHLTEQFNNLSTFVASDIVCEENIKKRVRKVKQWINVAWECKNLNNLNGCNSIVSAFNNAGIHRLKKTWEAIPKRDVESERLKQLNELVSMTSSYKNMRDHMSRSGEGLPYIGIYLTDMVFIEDGNKDYITKEGSDLQLINFAKRRKIAEVIQRIKTQQQTLYDFISIPFLQKTFDFSNMVESEKAQLLLAEDVIWSKSLIIEPREQQKQ
ncbi:hypothetical protein C9374_013911 [Naegleria lovaniensis]|uniref:Uncharacterized protein n=1 Tax=Naegleria lovaniensis TaxID=51637 RepID=A0AA88KQ58_NAELO|nr:uncharacterized protein C9374_013911 [Naegleria lovaniensis]KAG2389351.1 hypothetical protein C9374_013911 [Naegleria lovaniensis]